MANLTAWKFDSPDGASQAVRTLKELQDEGLIVITAPPSSSGRRATRSPRPARSMT